MGHNQKLSSGSLLSVDRHIVRMQSGSIVSDTVLTDINCYEDSAATEWGPPKSSSPAFLITSPFASNDSFSAANNTHQTKANDGDLDNLNMWSPAEDKIYSGSTDSDTSGSFRDLHQPFVTNTHIPQVVASNSTSACNTSGPPTQMGSPIITEKKWMPQSPESSRYFNNAKGRNSISDAFSLTENSELNSVVDSSPNAVAVTHGSPLDLSFPVKDIRIESHDSVGFPSLGLGIAQGQRRGSHGDYSHTEYSSASYLNAPAPIGSPNIFTREGTHTNGTTSVRNCLDLLTHEHLGFESLNEVSNLS